MHRVICSALALLWGSRAPNASFRLMWPSSSFAVIVIWAFLGDNVPNGFSCLMVDVDVHVDLERLPGEFENCFAFAVSFCLSHSWNMNLFFVIDTLICHFFLWFVFSSVWFAHKGCWEFVFLTTIIAPSAVQAKQYNFDQELVNTGMEPYFYRDIARFDILLHSKQIHCFYYLPKVKYFGMKTHIFNLTQYPLS